MPRNPIKSHELPRKYVLSNVAAEMLGVSERTVRRYCDYNLLQADFQNGQWLIEVASVKKLAKKKNDYV